MSEKDNIEDWYRDELSNYEVNPESNGWDSISNQLDDAGPITEDNVESWYVKELEKFQSAPDQAVWNKLSTKLDVTSVWDKLLVSLNRYDRLIWWRNTTLKTSALLLLLLGGYYTVTNLNDSPNNNSLANSINSNNQTVSVNLESIVMAENDRLKNNGTVSEKLMKETSGGYGGDVSGDVSNDASTSSIANNSIDKNKKGGNTPLKVVSIISREDKEFAEKVESNKKESLLASANNNIERISPLRVGEIAESPKMFLNSTELKATELEINSLESKEFLVKKERNRIVFNSKRFSSHFVFGMYARRLYLGINGGVKYQTLFASSKQNELLSGFTKNQLMDFGGSVGATLGMIVSDKFNLEANINILSTSGCKHEYTNDINNFTEEINLEYSTVSVLAKKMNNKSTFDNKKYSTNYIGGVYVGVLTAGESNSGAGVSDLKAQFSNIDVGIVLGIEQDRYLTKEFVITPGVRFNQSILNTSNQSNEMMSASRNFSVEFNVGVKYIFLKKK